MCARTRRAQAAFAEVERREAVVEFSQRSSQRPRANVAHTIKVKSGQVTSGQVKSSQVSR